MILDLNGESMSIAFCHELMRNHLLLIQYSITNQNENNNMT